MGGAVEAIKLNFQDQAISKTAYEYQKSLESKENIVVGVNKYQNNNESNKSDFLINNDSIEKQLERLKKFKSTRNFSKTESSLIKLKNAACDNTNLIPFIIKSIESNATLGEISDVLREIYGEYS